ncbi:MAG: radical SAM protein, partial [Chloroflexota bacterium]
MHIPFCKHRCGYCDFNTFAGKEYLIEEYAKALTLEVKEFGQNESDKRPVHTIYFGGGTPSLLTIEELTWIFDAIANTFAVQPNAEITLEVNPGTVDLSYMAGLKALGVNRISMGVQSAIPRELTLLERQHGYEEAIDAIKFVRQAGIDNLSVDLIFGLPEQSLSDWQHNVELALELHPE